MVRCADLCVSRTSENATGPRGRDIEEMLARFIEAKEVLLQFQFCAEPTNVADERKAALGMSTTVEQASKNTSGFIDPDPRPMRKRGLSVLDISFPRPENLGR